MLHPNSVSLLVPYAQVCIQQASHYKPWTLHQAQTRAGREWTNYTVNRIVRGRFYMGAREFVAAATYQADLQKILDVAVLIQTSCGH